MANKKPSKMVTRDAFLDSARHLKKEIIELEGLGPVFVRELTGRQMLTFNEQIDAMKVDGAEVSAGRAMRLAALLVSMSACDENGELLFTEADVDRLSDLPFEKLRAVAEKALALSGLYTIAENLKKSLSDSGTSD